MKNHSPRKQKAVMAARMMPMKKDTGSVSRKRITEISQNQKWLKICVMA